MYNTAISIDSSNSNSKDRQVFHELDLLSHTDILGERWKLLEDLSDTSAFVQGDVDTQHPERFRLRIRDNTCRWYCAVIVASKEILQWVRERCCG